MARAVAGDEAAHARSARSGAASDLRHRHRRGAASSASALYDKFGDRFVERLLLPAEAAGFRRHTRTGAFLAMRFAAKESDRRRPWAPVFATRHVDPRLRRGVPTTLGRPRSSGRSAAASDVEQLGIGEGHVTLTGRGWAHALQSPC
jgi:hypothetical protein